MGGHFGPGVIGDKAYTEEQAVVERHADHFGPGVIGYPEDDFGPGVVGEEAHAKRAAEVEADKQAEKAKLRELASDVPEVWLLSGKAAAMAVKEIDDAPTLKAWHTREKAHPKYKGGRAGVLNAIEDQLGTLDISDDD